MILSETESLIVGVLFVLWFLFLIILSLKGSRWLRARAEAREGSSYGRYEKTVSYGMLFGAVILACILGMLLLSLISTLL